MTWHDFILFLKHYGDEIQVNYTPFDRIPCFVVHLLTGRVTFSSLRNEFSCF
jgi:hypothetical protein